MIGVVTQQLLRFCIVGCLNSGISYIGFFLTYRYWPFSKLLGTLPSGVAENTITSLRHMGLYSIDGAVSNVIGYIAGMVNGFVWNRHWTFKAVEEPKKQVNKFIVTNLACLLFSTVSIFVCTDINHWSYNLVWILTTLFLTVINFVLSKYWVFECTSAQATKNGA